MAGGRPTFKMDRKGISQVLKNLGPVTTSKANDLAERVRSSHPDVEVDVQAYTTDRAAATVMVKDNRGKELQITEGILTRAAAAVGLEVNPK